MLINHIYANIKFIITSNLIYKTEQYMPTNSNAMPREPFFTEAMLKPKITAPQNTSGIQENNPTHDILPKSEYS